MWGTSSPDGKLTGDLGNAIESTEIDGRRSRRPLAGKLSPDDFRLLQQYRPDSADLGQHAVVEAAQSISDVGSALPLCGR
jgi:hypothetical protein